MMRFVKKLGSQEESGKRATSVSARNANPEEQICVQALTKYLLYQRESLEYIASRVHNAFKENFSDEGPKPAFLKAQPFV